MSRSGLDVSITLNIDLCADKPFLVAVLKNTISCCQSYSPVVQGIMSYPSVCLHPCHSSSFLHPPLPLLLSTVEDSLALYLVSSQN